MREQLVELSYRASHLLHRRFLERHAFENTAEQMELLLDEAGVRRAPDRDPPAIVFIDLSGYTTLTEAEGDERAAERSAELARIVRGATVPHGGAVVKLLGDGAMLAFPNADASVTAALAIVEDVARAGLPAARAGVTAGPVIRRDGDYFGHTVNLAAGACDAAHAGSVLATSEVAALTADRPWADVGEVELKGVPHPVALFELTAPASGDGASV
jgi:adenylate cyclase